MSIFQKPLAVLVSLAILGPPFTTAQSTAPAPKFALTVDNIMRGSALVGYEPSQVRWSGDSERIYFRWKQASDLLLKDPDLYVVNRDGSGLRKLTEEETRLAPPSAADRTKDQKRAVYAQNGDIFLYDYSTDHARQITKTNDIESNPHFTRDGNHIYFTRANNLYVQALDDGSLTELTDIRPAATAGASTASAAPFGFGRGQGGRGQARATDTEEKKGTESQEFLKKEEKDLLEIVHEREEKKKEDEAKRKKENPRKPFTLPARQSVAALQLSPDEKYVIATVVTSPDGAKNSIVPNFVTDSAYTEDIPSRGKVGDLQPSARLAILSVESGEVKWVDHGQKQKSPQAETQAQKPLAQRERDVRLSQPVWSEDGDKAVLMARSADNKDRWILALDPATGKTRVLVDQHDDAWIDGPGALTLGWMKHGRSVYFQSEQTGYSHLYTVSYDGGTPAALTSGKWEVRRTELSSDKSRFYLTTSESDPGDSELYAMSTDGGARTRITAAPGIHAATVSPDDRWVADVYSYTNKPPELFVQENRPGADARKLTSSPAPEFWQYPWLDVPIVTIPTRDGARLRARFFKPKNFKRGGPAVVFVHGAGYMQNVHHGWSSYYHEYLFHHVLMEHGFAVLDADYRGSAGYGRDWRTGIYRHMGGKDLDDEVDAAKWLVSAQGVDPKRIGIYGGSYGGFMTLMAMFTQPGVFAAGAALRPVSDWAHYNHPYTSNILNLPQNDADAYKESSPIYFAQGLKGALLICHGMVDTNVHFQDTVRLVQRLIELHKDNWELAVYPVENHGFVEPSSWADEYKRILDLFDKNLKTSDAR